MWNVSHAVLISSHVLMIQNLEATRCYFLLFCIQFLTPYKVFCLVYCMEQCYVAKTETEGTTKNLLVRKEDLFSSLMVLPDLFNSIYFYGPSGSCTVSKLSSVRSGFPLCSIIIKYSKTVLILCLSFHSFDSLILQAALSFWQGGQVFLTFSWL